MRSEHEWSEVITPRMRSSHCGLCLLDLMSWSASWILSPRAGLTITENGLDNPRRLYYSS